MIETLSSFRSARLAFAALAALLLASCQSERFQTPPFYKDLARVDGEVDAATAAQMISQYRINNGLSAVTPDAQLTGIAKSQAEAMAKGRQRAGLARTGPAAGNAHVVHRRNRKRRLQKMSVPATAPSRKPSPDGGNRPSTIRSC